MAPNELRLGFLKGFKQGFSEANSMESRGAREEPEGRPEKPEDLQILRGDSPLAFSPLPGPAALPSGSSLASPDSIK